MQLLPAELLEAILDNLTTVNFWDINSLRACSTVFSALRIPAQKRLFSSVILKLRPVPASLGERFFNLIADPQSAHIAPFVRKLWIRTLRWDNQEDTFGPEYKEDRFVSSWYKENLLKYSLSIQHILHLLTNLKTLRLGVESFPFPLEYLHPASRDAIVQVCKTQIVFLDLSRQPASFLFQELAENEALRGLAIREMPNDVASTAAGPSVATARGSSTAQREQKRIRLETLCVHRGSWAAADDRRKSWIRQSNCPTDVTQLRRLVITSPLTLHPEDILPLCASTLEELTIDNLGGGKHRVASILRH